MNDFNIKAVYKEEICDIIKIDFAINLISIECTDRNSIRMNGKVNKTCVSKWLNSEDIKLIKCSGVYVDDISYYGGRVELTEGSIVINIGGDYGVVKFGKYSLNKMLDDCLERVDEQLDGDDIYSVGFYVEFTDGSCYSFGEDAQDWISYAGNIYDSNNGLEYGISAKDFNL